MSTFELAKELIVCQRYQIVEEDSSNGRIAFRFQMNTIHLWTNAEDEHFFVMTLPNFAEVNEPNKSQVIQNCHQINKEAKLVKLYVLSDVILAAAEIYYLAREDFKFQMLNALKHLVAAKVMYKKLDV